MTYRKQSNELLLIENEISISEKSKEHFFHVDLLKAAMIFLVIFDHIVGWGVKGEIGVTFWERISIPVFLVIMGFNMGISFQRKGDMPLKKMYSWAYFKNKILRYIVPFLVLYGFSTLIGLTIYRFNIAWMYNRQYYPNHGIINLFYGILPFWGPGNWFLPVIFQSILIMPLLYKAFRKKPILALISCFIVEILMHILIFFIIGEITSWEEVHILSLITNSVLFLLPGIGIGMWFSFGYKLIDKRNLFIWILFPLSLAYCIAYQFFNFRFRFGNIPLLRGDYSLLFIPYSAFLVLLAINFLPQKLEGRISRAISMIGKSTYHILLTQMIGYGIIHAIRGTHYLIDAGFTIFDALLLIYAWLIFIPLGVLWYKIDQEKNIIRRLLYYVNFFLFEVILVYSLFIGFILPSHFEWVPIPFVIILIYGAVGLIVNVAMKKPIKTVTLAIWTSFMVYNFFMTILYVMFLPPTEYLMQNITIGIYLISAIIGTVLDYTYLK